MQLARMVIRFYPQPHWFLIFDDTFIYQNSKKALGSGIFHQHGNTINRLFLPQASVGSAWLYPSQPARNIPQLLSCPGL
ncbi:MAG: hypothetical protein CSA33_08420 [Desulfobulbus propionicus]|nr:MAG: hypothetical protein CSA33_08420 [Desulfobulbus propionicus]